MPITAGSISLVRRINTGDYSHKEVKAEVHWTSEGDAPGVQSSAGEAQDLALSMVATTLATIVKLNSIPQITVGPESVKSDQVEAGFPAFAVAKRHRRTKAEMAAARAEVTEFDRADGKEPRVVEVPLADPTPDPAPEPVQNPVASIPQSDAVPAPAEITDKELNNACNETMQRIKNKPAIQHIIELYTDGVVSTIPQESRSDFLTELKAL